MHLEQTRQVAQTGMGNIAQFLERPTASRIRGNKAWVTGILCSNQNSRMKAKALK